MNPNIIRAHVKGRRLRVNEENAIAHLNGVYTRDALMATVGNMFKKKGAKSFEYPDKPYDLGSSDVAEQDNMNLTESEKIERTDMLFKQLRLMQANFNLAHGIDNGDNE